MRLNQRTKWSRFNQELQEKLKDYQFTYEQVWQITGCGYKTLQRYMDRELVHPIKVNDVWYFTSELLDKVKFIYELRNQARIPVEFSAALFDYMKSKKVSPDYQELLKRVPEWALYNQ